MRVIFVQKFIPHYRLPFFEAVKRELNNRNIEFHIIYGEADPFEGSKVKMVHPEWATKVNSRILKVAGRYIYWQGAAWKLKKGDFVVAEHAAKLLDNYILYFLSRMGYIHFGYFGHGENFQAASEFWISRKVKKMMLHNVTRWFAYTEVSRNSLLSQGVDENLISVVNNTLEKPYTKTPDFEKQRNKFLFIGGLYANKRPDLIIAAAEIVAIKMAQENEPFELHIVGEGPLLDVVLEAEARYDWLTYHGSLYGDEKEQMLISSVAILVPWMVGLVAVDSLHFRCPILTTSMAEHSPEVAYLKHEVNALIGPENSSVESFASLIERYICEPGLSDRLQNGCGEDADRYTISAMAESFISGVDLVYKNKNCSA